MDGRKSPVAVPKKIIKSQYLEKNEKTIKTGEGTLSRASSAGSSVEIVDKTDLTTDFGGSPKKEETSQEETADQTPSHATSEPVKDNSCQVKTDILVNLEKSVTEQENVESSELPSHCSAAGTCFSEHTPSMPTNSRVFVFPEDCPGYEVLSNSTTFSSK